MSSTRATSTSSVPFSSITTNEVVRALGSWLSVSLVSTMRNRPPCSSRLISSRMTPSKTPVPR
jgi:hypothetical protein